MLQALEAPALTPQTGSVVRVSRDGTQQTVIARSLFLPGGMTNGPDGNLYISSVALGPPPVGLGQILKVRLPREGTTTTGTTRRRTRASPERLRQCVRLS